MCDELYSITLGGGHTAITIKQRLTAHTTPEQLSDELQRRREEGGMLGGRKGSSGEEKRAASAELAVLWRGTLTTAAVTRVGCGTPQLCGTPH